MCLRHRESPRIRRNHKLHLKCPLDIESYLVSGADGLSAAERVGKDAELKGPGTGILATLSRAVSKIDGVETRTLTPESDRGRAGWRASELCPPAPTCSPSTI